MAMVKRRQNQKLPKKKIATPKMDGRRKAKYHVKDGDTRFKTI
jgi:hypothetical protein